MSDKATKITELERKVFGDLLKARLSVIEKDLNYVAKESGVCPRTLHEWILGHTTPDYIKMLKVVGVAYDHFHDFAYELEEARNAFVKPAELVAESLKQNGYVAAKKKKSQRQNRKNNPKKD